MTEINLKRQLVPYEWLQLPVPIRNLFKATFQIPRSGGSNVIGDKIVSDGHTIDDLSRVSLKSLQEYLGTTETHWDKLLQLTINKMELPDNGNAEITTPESPRVEPPTVSRRGRPKKIKETV
jgi:hypothetical protein